MDIYSIYRLPMKYDYIEEDRIWHKDHLPVEAVCSARRPPLWAPALAIEREGLWPFSRCPVKLQAHLLLKSSIITSIDTNSDHDHFTRTYSCCI